MVVEGTNAKPPSPRRSGKTNPFHLHVTEDPFTARFKKVRSNKKLLGTRALLLVTKGITTSSILTATSNKIESCASLACQLDAPGT